MVPDRGLGYSADVGCTSCKSKTGCDHRKGDMLAEVDRTLAETKNNTGLTLVLALNYGSRAEITDAVRAIAEKVKRGQIEPRDIEF